MTGFYRDSRFGVSPHHRNPTAFAKAWQRVFSQHKDYVTHAYWDLYFGVPAGRDPYTVLDKMNKKKDDVQSGAYYLEEF